MTRYMKTDNEKRATKDKVLHTRIPEQLDQQIRDNAGRLGLSVSTVVRNVLTNTFGLVEGVVHDSLELTNVVTGQARTNGRQEKRENERVKLAEPEVFGWQEITLNVNGLCHSCNAIMPKGCKGHIAIPIGGQPVFKCCDCLAALSNDGENQ